MERTEVIDIISAYIHNSPKCSCSHFSIKRDIGVPMAAICYEDLELCPDKCVESRLWFFDTVIEARVYYTETAQKWVSECGENRAELLEVINFINAHFFVSEGFITPKLYVTEDCDISYTVLLDYGLFDDKQTAEKTLEFLTGYMPSFLNNVSHYIFSTVLGIANSSTAISKLKSDLLEE